MKEPMDSSIRTEDRAACVEWSRNLGYLTGEDNEGTFFTRCHPPAYVFTEQMRTSTHGLPGDLLTTSHPVALRICTRDTMDTDRGSTSALPSDTYSNIRARRRYSC